jgi:hypothetical protein
MNIYSIYLDDGHLVLVEVEIHLGESREVDDAKEVGLSWQDREFDILSVVDQCRIWKGLRAF